MVFAALREGFVRPPLREKRGPKATAALAGGQSPLSATLGATG